MAIKPPRGADLLGAARLALEATAGVTDLAEAVHMAVLDRVAAAPVLGPILGPALEPILKPVRGLTTLVYRSVKGVTRVAGGGLDAALSRLQPLLGQSGWAGREPVIAALNGILGDRLAASANPLAIPMQLRRNGMPLDGALKGRRLLVLVHGLCMNDLQWARAGEGHGAALERERGYTALYLHYNSGLHISTNGRALAGQLAALLDHWPEPVDELVILGHSMGGLIARSACHYGREAGHAWPGKLSKLVCLGSPHHGAPLERGGNWVHLLTDASAFSAPFSRLAKIRSAGITDLRHGSVLDADWQGRDRFEQDPVPHTLALPRGVRCYALAATLGRQAGGVQDHLGDGLVPLASALGRHADPARQLAFAAADQAVLTRTGHLDLLSSPQALATLLVWL